MDAFCIGAGARYSAIRLLRTYATCVAEFIVSLNDEKIYWLRHLQFMMIWPNISVLYGAPTPHRIWHGACYKFNLALETHLELYLFTKKVKVAHTRLPSGGFWNWSRFLAVSLQVMRVINLTLGCHYFPPGPQLPSQHLRGLLPISLLGEQRHMGVNSLPKTATWQRRGCDSNPGPSAPESSMLTTRSHLLVKSKSTEPMGDATEWLQSWQHRYQRTLFIQMT